MPEERFTTDSPSPPAGMVAALDRDKGKQAPASSTPPPSITWSMTLTNLGVQLMLAVLGGILTTIVLLFLDTEGSIARGSGVVGAIIALWIVRSLVHWPIPKAALASRTQLPPNVKAAETGGREVVETVVFVVVLVLLLKSFAA